MTTLFDFDNSLPAKLANAAYDLLIALDAQCRVISINESAKAVFGYSDPIDKRLSEVTGSLELETMVMEALANHEEVYEEQLNIVGHIYRARTMVVRHEDEIYIGLALQDVTQLVRLNRARRDMVANISHELRTPIANIRLIIDSLFHEEEKPKRKRSIASLQAIGQETDQLMRLVQELHDLSMIESGQAILRMTECPLKELVDGAVERIQDQSDDKDLNIVKKIPEDIQVLCDADQTRRVLTNLLNNAIKWSPKGGKIVIRADNGGDEVTVRVDDNGPGVPDDQVERIFERFYQVDGSRTGSGSGGSGLGLAICKHIVEAHGGHIWAEGRSERPGGHFAFTLLNGESEGDNPEFA